MSTSRGPQTPYTQPELPEPYESLARWVGAGGAEVGSNAAGHAQTRLMALLVLDLRDALRTFNATTTRLNTLLVVLTAVLVAFGAVQIILAVTKQ